MRMGFAGGDSRNAGVLEDPRALQSGSLFKSKTNSRGKGVIIPFIDVFIPPLPPLPHGHLHKIQQRVIAVGSRRRRVQPGAAPGPGVRGCCRGRGSGAGFWGRDGEVGWHHKSLRVPVQPGPILLSLLWVCRGDAELERRGRWWQSIRASPCPGWGWGGEGGLRGCC